MPLQDHSRARRYLASCQGAVSGQHGHTTTFAVACALVKGFDFSQSEALQLLSEWNTKCSPPWSESELVHKIQSADEAQDKQPRGYILRAREQFSPKSYTHSLPPLNPFKAHDAPTLDIQFWLKNRLALAGTAKLESLKPSSIDEIISLSPQLIPNSPQENLHSFLSKWDDCTKLLWMGGVEDSGSPENIIHFNTIPTWKIKGLPTKQSLFTSGCSYKENSYSRCKENIDEHRFIIVESDKYDHATQCAIFKYLISLGLPISMIVNTMGVSLHAWIDRRKLSDEYVDKLQTLLCGIHNGLEPDPNNPGKTRRKFIGGMGCDPATFRGSQPTRLPGATRPPSPNKTGGLQHLIYLD